jgi:hypothetical protein
LPNLCHNRRARIEVRVSSVLCFAVFTASLWSQNPSKPPTVSRPGGNAATPYALAETKSSLAALAPVTFVQITDAHVFDGGKARATETEAREEQEDDWQAFRWSLQQINRLHANGVQINFVVFTGDWGLEFVQREGETPCHASSTALTTDAGPPVNPPANAPKAKPPKDEFQQVKEKGWIKLYSFDQAARTVAEELSILQVPVVYLLPGNNDVVNEDPCDGQRYTSFVNRVGSLMRANQPRIVDLSAVDPAPEYASFVLFGLNSATFKSDDNYRDTCADNKKISGCPEFELSRLRAAVEAGSASSLFLIFTHVPDLYDPYCKPGANCPVRAWRSFGHDPEWRALVANSHVAGIFAGHFHDARRFLYGTASNQTGLAVDPDVATKTWVAPPLAMKNQDKATQTARGFLLVRAQKVEGNAGGTPVIWVVPFWFEAGGSLWCPIVRWVVFVLVGLLAILVVVLILLRKPAIPATDPAKGLTAPQLFIAAYPTLLTLALLALIGVAIWKVMEFAIHELAVEPFYWLIPIFGAFGGIVGGLIRGDGGEENKFVLATFESSFRIKPGIVGDVAIGIGGAATVVFLFERALPVTASSSSYALLVSISFIAGVFGKNIIDKAREKLEDIVKQTVKKEKEQDRDARKTARDLTEEASLAIKKGEFEKAVKLADSAIKMDPNYVNSYLEKGRALRRLNKEKEAKDVIEQAFEHGLEDWKLFYNLACYKSLLGYPKDETLDDLEKAIAASPGSKQLAENDQDFNNVRDEPRFAKLVKTGPNESAPGPASPDISAG